MQLLGRELDPITEPEVIRVRGGRRELTQGALPRSDAFLRGLDVVECADLGLALLASDRGPSAPVPFLLLGWLGPAQIPPDLPAMVEAWRHPLDQAGVYVMGSSFGGVESAGVLRLRDPRTLMRDDPVISIGGDSATIDVVLPSGRPAAEDLATGHPLAALGAVELRAFVL